MFGGGRKVLKYDINKATSSVIYELGQSEEGEQLAFYGAGLRVDPLTDNLILTVKHDGWGASGAYNWIYKLDNTGHEITHFALKGDNGSGEAMRRIGMKNIFGFRLFRFLKTQTNLRFC